jgi:archaellum biogenesis ATPase FlaH
VSIITDNDINTSNADVLSVIPEEPLEKRIFSALLKDDASVMERRQEFFGRFADSSLFDNEYFALYEAIKSIPKRIPNKEYLCTFIRNNRGKFQISSNVDMTSYALGDNNPFDEYMNSCCSVYDECLTFDTNHVDFVTAMETLKLQYLTRKTLDVLSESTDILLEGKEVGKRKLNGFDDMRQHLVSNLSKLDKISTVSLRKGIITYRYQDDSTYSDSKAEFICPYGVKALDAELKGIYEGEMISVLAPTKGGKSRFATFLLHQAIVNGKSVAMWSVENGYLAWEALIRARHFEWYFNAQETNVGFKKIINNNMILKDEMSDEIRMKEMESWLNLRTAENYGEIANIDEDFNSDNFLDILDAAVQKVGAKVVCIDYLQLLTDTSRNKTKTNVIAEAYIKTLQYLKAKKIAGIFPGQFKQVTIDDFKKTKEEDFISKEMRDIGGESAEVIRTPDVNLALYASQNDLRDGFMKLLSVPSRNSKPFDPINMYTELGSCTFASVDTR